MKIIVPILLGLLLAPLFLSRVGDAADLVLLSDGKSDYQIVVPDHAETEVLDECLIAFLNHICHQKNDKTKKAIKTD